MSNRTNIFGLPSWAAIVPIGFALLSVIQTVVALTQSLRTSEIWGFTDLATLAALLLATLVARDSWGRVARWAAVAAATLALVANVVSILWFLVAPAGSLMAPLTTVVTQVLWTVLAAVWAWALVAQEPAEALYVPTAEQEVQAVPARSVEASMQPGAPADPAQPQWATGTTPWPRRNEADPDGTLIRPARRP